MLNSLYFQIQILLNFFLLVYSSNSGLQINSKTRYRANFRPRYIIKSTSFPLPVVLCKSSGPDRKD